MHLNNIPFFHIKILYKSAYLLNLQFLISKKNKHNKIKDKEANSRGNIIYSLEEGIRDRKRIISKRKEEKDLSKASVSGY